MIFKHIPEERAKIAKICILKTHWTKKAKIVFLNISVSRLKVSTLYFPVMTENNKQI